MADEKRTLLVMLEPSDIKATAFLVQERKDTTDHMWLYLPPLDRIRQIIPVETYQRFLGTDLPMLPSASGAVTENISCEAWKNIPENKLTKSSLHRPINDTIRASSPGWTPKPISPYNVIFTMWRINSGGPRLLLR